MKKNSATPIRTIETHRYQLPGRMRYDLECRTTTARRVCVQRCRQLFLLTSRSSGDSTSTVQIELSQPFRWRLIGKGSFAGEACGKVVPNGLGVAPGLERGASVGDLEPAEYEHDRVEGVAVLCAIASAAGSARIRSHLDQR